MGCRRLVSAGVLAQNQHSRCERVVPGRKHFSENAVLRPLRNGIGKYWVVSQFEFGRIYGWSPAVRIEFTDRSIAINPISIKPAWMTLPVRARSNWTHRLPGRMCESTIAVRSLMDEYTATAPDPDAMGIESVRTRINRLLTNGHTSTPHPMIRNPMFRVLR